MHRDELLLLLLLVDDEISHLLNRLQKNEEKETVKETYVDTNCFIQWSAYHW
jgi:hypothetical protein